PPSYVISSRGWVLTGGGRRADPWDTCPSGKTGRPGPPVLFSLSRCVDGAGGLLVGTDNRVREGRELGADRRGETLPDRGAARPCSTAKRQLGTSRIRSVFVVKRTNFMTDADDE